MSGHGVKEVMEQIHISEEMQEEIIMNIQNQMENGRNKKRNWRKMATAAAALVLLAGLSIPVQALVENVVKERMEDIPKEEVQALEEVIQNQKIAAEGFSRVFSDEENRRYEELWESYQNGTFPEKKILQVDDEGGAMEGTLCYIKSAGVFHLPDRELTDEELLEIVDFQHVVSYAVEQGSAAQEAKAEYQEEQEKRQEQIQDADGISEEEAIEIATAQMKAELGASAEGKELLIVYVDDISGADYDHKGDEAYVVAFGNHNDHSTYTCAVDSANGSILYTVAH